MHQISRECVSIHLGLPTSIELDQHIQTTFIEAYNMNYNLLGKYLSLYTKDDV